VPSYRVVCSSVLGLLLSLTLIACSGNPETPNIPGAPNEPTTQFTALIIGRASSPFLNTLGKKVSFEQEAESSKVTDHDLIIFDGDTHSPASLVDHERLAQALDAGVWVLIADATVDHKRQVMLPRLGFAGQSATQAVLFRKVPNAAMPAFAIIEMSNLAEAGMTTLQAGCCTTAQIHHQAAFADRVVAKLEAGSCSAPLNIQEGIIYATWCYGISGQTATTGVQAGSRKINEGDTIDGKVVQMQTGLNDANYSFTLLLNNADVVTGDSQTLHVEVDGQMTPTTTRWPSGSGSDTGQPYFLGDWWSKKYDDASLLSAGRQSSLDISLGPVTEGILQSAANFAPQTPNNTETASYSSSTTFSISATLNAALVPLPGGGSGGGGGGSVTGTYSTTSTNTRSYSVPDWTGVADLAGQNTYNWRFDSHNPEVGPYEKGKDWILWGFEDYNQLNENLMAYSASAVWTTNDISSETVGFVVGATQYTVDVYTDVVGLAESKLERYNMLSTSDKVSLDLGTIIPVTLESKSLTFTDQQGTAITQENPVTAGEDVTATVQLSGPAPFAYNISAAASSRNDNATITQSPVGVVRGDTKTTFTIETNDNALEFGQTVAVPITLGSFGTAASNQLWIVSSQQN
jgi:hypothetical protein